MQSNNLVLTKWLLVVLLCTLLFVSPASAIIKACTACNSTCNTLPGVNGTSATITVNSTFTLTPGTSATFINIGTLTNAIFDVGIPEGQPGTMNMTPNMTAGAPGAPGSNGLNNMTMNLTPNMTAGTNGLDNMTMNMTMNLTPNMTAGVDGLNNMTMNLTPNMTAGTNGLNNMTMNLTPNMTAGTNGLNNMTMNLTPNMTAGADGLNNMTMNLTPNMTMNFTPNMTMNFTPNMTMNLTPNMTMNLTANMTMNFTPNMTMNQTINLTANMTAGPTGATGETGGGGGQILYFRHANSTDPISYETLYPVPAGSAEDDETVVVKTGLGQVYVDSYITEIGYPAATELPAGLWRFRTYHYVSSASGTTTAVFKVYNRTAGGAETLLFTTISDEINSLTVDEYLTSYVQTTSYLVASTDRIVVKVYGQSTHSSNVNFHFVYEGTNHTSHIQTVLETAPATSLSFSVIAGETLYKGEAVYISGASGGVPVVTAANNTNTAKSRVVGLMTTDVASGSRGQVRRAGVLTNVDTRSTNPAINPLGQTWTAGDLLFATIGGGLSNTRPTSGRSVKAAYTLSGSNISDTLMVYPMENPVWVTAAENEGIVLRLGDTAGNTNVSIRDYTNYEVMSIESDGDVLMHGQLSMSSELIRNVSDPLQNQDAATKNYVDINKANLTQYSYITLMAGSAMIPTTNPPSDFNQFETPTNKVNYIYANITNGTSQNVQWFIEMPSDWDGGNVNASFIWTVMSGSGDVNWTLSGLRFADNAVIDSALPIITYKTDTVQTANYMHISATTNSAAITGTGNTVIFKVGRSATSETCTVPAQLIGVRLKYGKIIGAI